KTAAARSARPKSDFSLTVITFLLCCDAVDIGLFSVEASHRSLETRAHSFERAAEIADLVVGLDRNRGVEAAAADVVGDRLEIENRPDGFAGEHDREHDAEHETAG